MFLLDPLAGIRQAREWLSQDAPTKTMLDRNALAEYAPEPVRRFVKDLQAGERFAYARVAQNAGAVPQVALVFLPPGVTAQTPNQFYCARREGNLDALRLTLPGKP